MVRSYVHFEPPAHVANEVAAELARVHLRRAGDGVHYAGRDDRFQVVDESRWSTGVPRAERYHVRDRSVPLSGCASDRRDLVATAPTQRAAAQRIAAILAAEGGAPRALRVTTPRGRYYTQLVDALERGEVTSAEVARRLAAWDAEHCAEFSAPAGELTPLTATERARIMRALEG